MYVVTIELHCFLLEEGEYTVSNWNDEVGWSYSCVAGNVDCPQFISCRGIKACRSYGCISGLFRSNKDAFTHSCSAQ
jgi:hypothetical protein